MPSSDLSVMGMVSEQLTKSADAAALVVVSPQYDAARSFIQSVCRLPTPSEKGHASVDQKDVLLRAYCLTHPEAHGLDELLKESAGVVFIVQFMDLLTMEMVKAAYQKIIQTQSPLVVCIFREENQTDYKISCPSCGQKLWIQDSDVGKKGRCPNCKKSFILPSQSHYLRGRLKIPEDHHVVNIFRKQVAAQEGVLTAVFQSMAAGA